MSPCRNQTEPYKELEILFEIICLLLSVCWYALHLFSRVNVPGLLDIFMLSENTRKWLGETAVLILSTMLRRTPTYSREMIAVQNVCG